MFYKEITRYIDKYNKEFFKIENDYKRIIPIGPGGWDSEDHMIFPSRHHQMGSELVHRSGQ